LLYDTGNGIIADAGIEPLAVDERSLAKKNPEVLAEPGQRFGKRKAPVVFDRGYPSKDFIKYLQDKEIKYVMRVRKGFSGRIGRLKKGSKLVRAGEGITVRVLVFTLACGEKEALVTNLDEGKMEDGAFAELYCKRWPVETKYSRIKQKLGLENFSGRPVENIRQNFYAVMTVSNMLAGCVREANGKIQKEQAEKGNRYEYHANVNHAAGVLKDRLTGILIADGLPARKYLCRELVSGIKRRAVPVRPNREVPGKEYLKKPHFHHNHKSNC
jgi:hypothetical protein